MNYLHIRNSWFSAHWYVRRSTTGVHAIWLTTVIYGRKTGHWIRNFMKTEHHTLCLSAPMMMYLFQNVMNGVIYVPARLRPIPEFTDTTDTNTLDLHRCRYQVPSTDTGSDVTAAMTSCIAWALSSPVMKVLNISISTPITIFWKPFTITIVMSVPILLT